MARYKLRSPDQPWPLRFVLGLFEFAASLKLAVVLIFSAAAVLAVGTFVESAWGTPAVQYGVYGTWWFTLLNVLLAINIFAAAAIRFPWKRHQTGFVITHIGLLIMLYGCWLLRSEGIDAQMPIFEGQSASKAYSNEQEFQLDIRPLAAFQDTADPTAMAGAQRVVIPFRSGPFNWQDVDQKRALEDLGLLWKLALRDEGVIYDRDGIRLEVLDYYANSQQVDAPELSLEISMPQMGSEIGADGVARQSTEVNWQPFSLSVTNRGSIPLERPAGFGNRQQLGGGAVTFWMASGPAETEAFLNSSPAGELGAQGQVVLYAGGQKSVIDVAEKLGAGRFPLPGTELEAEVEGVFRTAVFDQSADGVWQLTEGAEPEDPAGRPGVQLAIHAPDATERLMLFAGFPEQSQQAYGQQVFGTYWLPQGDKTSEDKLAGRGDSRIDVIQGADQQLLYRYWKGNTLQFVKPLPGDQTPVEAFEMPFAKLQMRVARHIATDRPGKEVIPLPYDKELPPSANLRAAKVRLTIDEQPSEFWIVGMPIRAFDGPPSPGEQEVIIGDSRVVTVRMPLVEVDTGFQVKLLDFTRKLDPGTSQPSHYSSTVQFFSPEGDQQLGADEVLITMNAPVDVLDPVTGRPLRMFQESFNGPFGPDHVYYRRFAAADQDHLYLSVLTVNYNPGRFWLYLGGLLITLGIATMFWMRAYFFTKPPAERKQQLAAGGRKPLPPRDQTTDTPAEPIGSGR